MKPFICLAAILACETAMAQTRCYDPFVAPATYRYNPATGYSLIGDVITAPCSNVSRIEIGFVALGPGTYNVAFNTFINQCLGCSSAPSIPVTIPAGGPFPSAWRIGLTPSSTIPGPMVGFSVMTNHPNFWPAFTVNAPGIPRGNNGISIDLNPTNGCLNPALSPCAPPAEWYSVGDQTNQLVALITTPSPVAILHGPFANDYQVDVEPENVPVILTPTLWPIDPDR